MNEVNAIALKNHIEFKKTSVSHLGKIQDIERDIRKFLDYVKKPLDKITETDLIKFLNSLDYKISTINNMKVHIKVFLKWYFPDWSAKFRNLDKICKQQKAPKTYTPEEMISLDEFEKLVNGEPDMMYKVYWLVFFYGGFRPSEACRLKWEQVFFEPEGAIIKLRTTKTKKDFYKSLPKNAEHLLKEWKKFNSSEYLFPSPAKKDRPILARSVCGRLKRLSKKVLKKEVVPYQLRHSIATILYKDDKRKDDDTANQLGHTKSMKQVYMNLDSETIKAKARALWIKPKPLSPEERDRLKLLEKEVKEIRELFTPEAKEFLEKFKEWKDRKLAPIHISKN